LNNLDGRKIPAATRFYLVLLEPVTHAAGDRIGLGSGKEFLVQGQYRVTQ
jgi:hypothetical protein